MKTTPKPDDQGHDEAQDSSDTQGLAESLCAAQAKLQAIHAALPDVDWESDLINMSRWDLLEHNTNPWGTWDRARTQRAKRKRAKPDAWRTEAQTARRDLLAAVATMHEPDPILYGDDLQRHIRAKVHKAVRLLCRSIMAWARARDLAHVAQNAAALDYCTRGLRAAQLTPRPPLWCPEIEEPEA